MSDAILISPTETKPAMISSALATSIMISPALAQAQSVPTRSLGSPLWDLAGRVPSLDLNFAQNRSLVDATTGLNLITFSRTSDATFVDSNGLIQTASAGTPRFDHSPITGESLGLLIEEARIQILELTDTLATQTKTVTAVAHTLSFYGTGTVVLSGAHSATVAGLGAYPTRTTLTFTPSAGSLTLTVSGSVRFAQLEAGGFATSYIPNPGTSQVTRAADVASISGSNFSSWYRQDEGTIYDDAFREFAVPSAAFPVIFDARVQSTDVVQASYLTEALAGQYVVNNTVTQSELYPTGFVNVRRRRLASAYGTNNFAICGNGNTPLVDSLGTPPSNIASVFIGSVLGSAQHLNGTIRRLTYWPQRLPNATLQAITQ